MQQKYEYTENPSIQGMWNSFTNVDPKIALAQFPNVSSINIVSLYVSYRIQYLQINDFNPWPLIY